MGPSRSRDGKPSQRCTPSPREGSWAVAITRRKMDAETRYACGPSLHGAVASATESGAMGKAPDVAASMGPSRMTRRKWTFWMPCRGVGRLHGAVAIRDGSPSDSGRSEQ